MSSSDEELYNATSVCVVTHPVICGDSSLGSTSRTRPPFPWETPGPKPLRTQTYSDPPSPTKVVLFSPRKITPLDPWPDTLSETWINVAIKPYERDSDNKVPMDHTLFPSTTIEALWLVQDRMVEVKGLVRFGLSGPEIVRRLVVRAVRWAVDVARNGSAGSSAADSKAAALEEYHGEDDDSLRADVDSEKVASLKAKKTHARSGSEVSDSTLVDHSSTPLSKATISDYDALLSILSSLNIFIRTLSSRLSCNRNKMNESRFRSTSGWAEYHYHIEESRKTVRCLAHLFVILGLAAKLLRGGHIARYQTTYLGRDLTSLHSALGGLIHTYDSSSRSSSPFSPSKPDSHSAAASNSSLIALKSEKGDNKVHDDGAMNEVLERLEWALRGSASMDEKRQVKKPKKMYEEYSFDSDGQ